MSCCVLCWLISCCMCNMCPDGMSCMRNGQPLVLAPVTTSITQCPVLLRHQLQLCPWHFRMTSTCPDPQFLSRPCPTTSHWCRWDHKTAAQWHQWLEEWALISLGRCHSFLHIRCSCCNMSTVHTHTFIRWQRGTSLAQHRPDPPTSRHSTPCQSSSTMCQAIWFGVHTRANTPDHLPHQFQSLCLPPRSQSAWLPLGTWLDHLPSTMLGCRRYAPRCSLPTWRLCHRACQCHRVTPGATHSRWMWEWSQPAWTLLFSSSSQWWMQWMMHLPMQTTFCWQRSVSACWP